MAYCNICNTSNTALVMKKNGFNLVRCNYDGHLFVDNPPDHATLDRIYTREYFEGHSPVGYHHNVFEAKEKQIAKARRKLELIRQESCLEGKLLDVGAGPGFFVKAASIFYDATGLDVSEAAAEYAKATFGLDIEVTSFENYQNNDSTFDIITMWSIIEHTLDPRQNLEHANQLLSSGGLLALSFPNSFGLTRYLRQTSWRGFQFPEHLHFFNNSNLAKLLRRTGFEPIKPGWNKNNFFRDTCYMLAIKR